MEINELDWKLSLSDNKERLIEHLYPQGGYLIYGISDAGAVLAGVDQGQVLAATRSIPSTSCLITKDMQSALRA